MAGKARNGWEWMTFIEIAGLAGNGWKWLTMDMNG